MRLPAKSMPSAGHRTVQPQSVRLATAALLLALSGSALAGRASAPGCPAAMLIAEAATLQRAIACAPPQATLRLAPGAALGVLELRGKRASGLVITSADPLRPARFTGLTIRDSAGLSLRNLTVEGPLPNGWLNAVQIRRSSQIDLRNLQLTGPGATARSDTAVMVQDSDHVTLRQLRITAYRNGITLLNSRDLMVEQNAIYRLLNDGIRGGGIERVLIARNLIGGFIPAPGSHADGIQLWTRNQTAASRDITIRHNLIIKGNGQPIQGIFVRDSSRLPFQRLEIDGNAVIGGNFHGISVNGADGVKVSQNMVVPIAPQLSWIKLQATSNALASGNRAGKFVLMDNGAGRSNEVIRFRKDFSKDLRGWLNLHRLNGDNFPLAVLQDEILRDR